MSDSSADIEYVKASLQSHTIFSSLNDDELLGLCSNSTVKNFAASDALIKEEAPNHFLYLIVEGNVDIKSYGIKMHSQSKGSLMGVISAAGLGSLTDDSATVEVVAATAVKAICTPIESIQTLRKSNESFSEALYNAAMSRLLS